MWTVVKLVGRRTKEKVPRARRTSLSDVSAGYSTEPWIKVVSRDCMRTFQFWVIASSRNTSRRYVDCLLSNIIMLLRPVAVARCNRYFYVQRMHYFPLSIFLFCFTRRYFFTLPCELWYHAIHLCCRNNRRCQKRWRFSLKACNRWCFRWGRGKYYWQMYFKCICIFAVTFILKIYLHMIISMSFINVINRTLP